GEEIGMTNAKFGSIDDYNDIETKDIYHDFINNKKLGYDYTMKSIYLKSRDNARTPMQWTSNKNAGFTNGTPWMKMNPNYKEINVQDALNDPDSVWYYYKKLIELRHKLPVITTGRYVLLDKDNEETYSYLRKTDDEVLYVNGNFTADKQTVEIPESLKGKKGQIVISNFDKENINDNKLELPPYGAVVYLYKLNKK